jgi:prolyl-tRNA synthetase
VSGIYDVNETKLQHIVGCAELRLASPETVKKVTGVEVGYAGILNLPKQVKIILDDSLKGRKNFECGANKTNYHSINVNFDRDFPEPERFYDIAMAREGDFAKGTKKKLTEKRGIEVGNIFQLGYHYTDLMKGAEYTDKQGKRQKYYMGCYGIGIGRTMAAVVEKYHDKNGITWPKAVAPFDVHLLSMGEDKAVKGAAEKLYEQLQDSGIEVLYDDRDVRPGEKFADADLMGIPIRAVVGKKYLENKKIEVKYRTRDKTDFLEPNKLISELAGLKKS